MSRQYRPDDPTNPAHYRDGQEEAIDRIRHALTPQEFEGYCLGNAMKYEIRAGKKGDNPVEQDLAKAHWYRQMRAHAQSLGRVPDPRDELVASW